MSPSTHNTDTHPTCTVTLKGDIAFVRVGAGLMTPDALVALRADAVAKLNGFLPRVFVSDMRAPLWALAAADLNRFFDDGNAQVRVPAALVVPTGCLDLFKGHAWDIAQQGIMRKIFTQYDAAVQWAELRAALSRQGRTAP